MLYCPQHLHLRLHLPHNHRHFTVSGTLNNQSHSTPQNPATTHEPILRTHNSKSANFLHRHLKEPSQFQNEGDIAEEEERFQPAISPEEKVKLLEMALVTKKRIPQFPGSIVPLFPANGAPLQTLFQNGEVNSDGDDDDDEEMIMKALEIRRKVTAEIFKDSMMKKGKFGITYSTNLVDRSRDFMDFIMIKAANLKSLPEFQNSSFKVRAKTVIEELEVVPLIRWLKHNSVSYPKIAKLLCTSRGNIKSIIRVVEWLKGIHVKGDFLGSALIKAGDNILERSNEELDDIVEYLESNGIRRDWIGYVMSRCPHLLSYTLEDVKARVKFYLDMGMNEKDFGTMVFDYPRALGYFTLEEMNQKVSYLKEFGLNTEDVGKLLAFKPQLIACSIEERWKPLVKYLYYLGISKDGMRRMLTIKPIVFCVDFEQTILPKVRFFKDIGVREDAIGNMLVKFPPLLTYSLNKKIRPVVIFLMTKAGVNERAIGKVIALGPELLGCSIVHKLDISVKYFLSLGIRLHLLGEMIADFPMLLRYNIDLLRPKYRYLRRSMVRPLKDLIEFPRFFSYSLEGRIVPRHKVMVENQVNFKLRYMLSSSDEQFKKMVEDAVERRRKFESSMMNVTLSDELRASDSLKEKQVFEPHGTVDTCSQVADGTLVEEELGEFSHNLTDLYID
ncbi:transcription termination factor MTERF2, chloroplastic [Euphorbia lathyris]|uniref:transcription termination factor MTERF2, chloroplastic n=1 Tax=Euphorbia lathyris TaxID=212925 RepID=UPI003313EF27